ncbi:hypothetical protein HPP92_010430 [Vanilla planifolia]|uniref:Uncharacterized protein n=1 Tax=Vanilla planifolia TaxID=51239 RepID=A0A835QYV9_VANPL|nr:hypothetical protein HPP92_010430 [Vanilla planifolia]
MGEPAEQKPMASKRPCYREDGTSDGSHWRAPGAKRRCCCLTDPELTLKEFMEKLNPSDLQTVQNLCKNMTLMFLNHLSG